MGGLLREPTEVQERCKKELYRFFEHHLSTGSIPLGSSSGSFDAERKPIDTIVIHHTSNPPGVTPNRLSAIELIRLYAPYFMSPASAGDEDLRGRAIFSGHEREGRQVFWPYHWIIRHDGQAERLLNDDEVGWHAGDWDVNCRSVAIVLDGDYEWSRPSRTELLSIAGLIARQYPWVPLTRILGHREVKETTVCPSNLFITKSPRGWKDELIGELLRMKRVA